MKIYSYWAKSELTVTDRKGRPVTIGKWCGSNDSQDAARQGAVAAVRTLAGRFGTKDFRGARDYAYAAAGLPEEIIGPMDPACTITRNRYGALVLNTETALFADIDVRRGLFGWLSGKTEAKYLARLEAWLPNHPEAGVRVYRTAAGLRYLFTHAPLRLGAQTIGWLGELGADPLYVTICRAQECYRARLSPKPWRIGLKEPPNAYPRETPDKAALFAAWLSAYEAASASYAVCAFLGAYGAARVDRDLARIVEAHDRATGVGSALPLA